MKKLMMAALLASAGALTLTGCGESEEKTASDALNDAANSAAEAADKAADAAGEAADKLKEEAGN